MAAKIPDRGFCISDRVSPGYNACFSGRGAKGRAMAAARRLVAKTYRRVDIVQVQDHGNMRFVVGEEIPRSWKR